MDKTILIFISLFLIAFVVHKIDMYIFNIEVKKDLEILKRHGVKIKLKRKE